VTAFGLDLRAFTGFGATADMKVFAPDGTTLIGDLPGIALPNSGVPVFAGWQDAGGIGAVQFTQDTQPWSPIIDNLEYGSGAQVIPEPSSFVLAGLAITFAASFGWRRRIRLLCA
jgi:hypothetical protein